MEEILGIAMIYSWIHFTFIQHNKTYEKRTDYEKLVTWSAIVAFTLYVLGTI